jgi:hypothetical protein
MIFRSFIEMMALQARALPIQLCRFSRTILLLLLLSGQLHAQDGTCSLNLANLSRAPEFLGFHLGMTREQVKVRVPQVVFGKTNELGVSKTTINPHFDPRIDQSTFDGVRSVSLDFLDDRLTSLWIGYDSSFKDNSVEEFVKRISQSLSLPEAWKPWRSRGRQMNCADFQLTVTMVADGPSFRIVDLGAEDLLAARRETRAELEATAAESNETTGAIVADKRSKVYYPAGCQLIPRIADVDRVIFKSTEEADKAGFKAAKDCD